VERGRELANAKGAAYQLPEEKQAQLEQAKKVEWMTAVAAFVGIGGVSLGFWWADAVAAIFIAASVIQDGFASLKDSVFDLMDEVPTTVGDQEPDPLIERLRAMLEEDAWVAQAEVCLREEGDIFTSEAFIVPKNEQNILDHLERIYAKIEQFDWRLHDVVVVPLRSLDE
jgi:predicted RecA/RadA family phage recombinase